MKAAMRLAHHKLSELVESSESTTGMYVRVHGDHLILGRPPPESEDDQGEGDDRVRLTHLSAREFGLSVKRHNGRWERTPFTGTPSQLFEVILSFMQHLVAPV
jgi:hypothetical protein